MRIAAIAVMAGLLFMPLATQAADISLLPEVHIGYLWTEESSGPGIALPFNIKEWDVGPLKATASLDLLFGGTTDFISAGQVPAALGLGLTISDERKRMHFGASYTTEGHVAGFIGWNVLSF